jgi:multiple sugar transport system ATP-binding protein
MASSALTLPARTGIFTGLRMVLSVGAKTIFADSGRFVSRRRPVAVIPFERSNMAGVVLENVSRVYPGNVVAVNGVRLEVKDREFLVLVGPSGCGKTTTLRVIAGLDELSSGTITIGSRVVNDVPPRERDVAMVFQNYALYPHMTVARNMAFGLELREKINGFGWLRRWALSAKRTARLAVRQSTIAERVHETARVLGIEDLLQRFPRQLSGGQRQRVALGRAMVRRPAVFLFDEPLSNLDAKLRGEMRRELKQLHRRLQTTMIYVTHDQVEALTLGERIAVMNEGTIQQVGRPMEVYDWPANRFVAGFIGMPAMNFVEGALMSEGNRLEFHRGDWSVSLASRMLRGAAAPGRAAVLGVRPEDVQIEPGSSAAPHAIPAVVSMVEMLGDACLATLEIATSETDTSGDTCTSGEIAAKDNGDSKQKIETMNAQHNWAPTYVSSRMEPRSNLAVGQQVRLGVDAARVHLFDPLTGENWVCKPAAA